MRQSACAVAPGLVTEGFIERAVRPKLRVSHHAVDYQLCFLQRSVVGCVTIGLLLIELGFERVNVLTRIEGWLDSSFELRERHAAEGFRRGERLPAR